jgi:hypothetical protein
VFRAGISRGAPVPSYPLGNIPFGCVPRYLRLDIFPIAVPAKRYRLTKKFKNFIHGFRPVNIDRVLLRYVKVLMEIGVEKMDGLNSRACIQLTLPQIYTFVRVKTESEGVSNVLRSRRVKHSTIRCFFDFIGILNIFQLYAVLFSVPLHCFIIQIDAVIGNNNDDIIFLAAIPKTFRLF